MGLTVPTLSNMWSVLLKKKKKKKKKKLTTVSEEWEYIGEQLGVKQSSLWHISTKHSDPGDCLREVLSKQFESCATTWGDIIAVLMSLCIGEFQLADNLEAKYYPSESLQLKFIECKLWKYYHNPCMLNMHGRNKVLHNLCNRNGIFLVMQQFNQLCKCQQSKTKCLPYKGNELLTLSTLNIHFMNPANVIG